MKHKFLFFIFKKMKNDFLTFIFHYVQTTVIYFRFDLERQICLLASIFVFLSRLLISVYISISCQDIGKEMLYKDSLLSLKIVSEQSTISGRVNWKYFVVLRRLSLSQFSEKITKVKSSRSFLKVNAYSSGCVGFQYNIACQ